MAIAALVRQRVKTKLAYRGDLFAGLLSGLLLAVVGPVFITTLFRHIPALGGWSGPEVLFVWGYADTVSGCFYVVFQGLYVLNRRYLLGAELDRLLVRPVDPYVQLLLDNLAFEELPSVLLGAFVMALAFVWGLPAPEPWRWAWLPVQVLGGLATLGGTVTAIASLGFHLHHRGTAVGLVMQLTTFSRYPLDLFGSPLRWLLTVALPFGFAGFYGAAFFLPRPEWAAFAWAAPVVGACVLPLGYGAWRLGLRAYTSGGG
jgi:ABC-2 type transport system permease protein